MKYFRSFLAGLIGSIALLAFYFITMRLLAGTWDAAWSQFEKLWYYMIPLSAGFGVQVGLYTMLRTRVKNAGSQRVMMASTTTSTVGMIACCAHHITDVLPILGLSAISLFLVKFQAPILFLGIVFNLFGIIHLMGKVEKLQQPTKN